jgi:MerR family transcriptional regulator, thiopeptide resistance regulator
LADTEKTYTVGELGKLFGLSRTALLYYDSMGLLKPSGRSASGYRRYAEADRARLERIVAFRSLGIPLASIPELLALPEEGAAGALLSRLFEINGKIEELRAQQRGILELLERSGSLRRGRARLGELVGLGSRLGIDTSNYRRFHASFERASPEEHRRLLGALGFTDSEIAEFLAELAAREE